MKLFENWFTEAYFNESLGTSFKVKKILHEEQSKFQKITVLETQGVGNLLLLDGKTMVSERDEFVYHEVMGHIPYMVHPQAKKILIIGGGDGGVVREYVKHPDITDIHLVEIDERVISVCKEYFPQVACGLDDKRVKIFAEDGIEFVKKHKNTYDIILVDSTDPEDFATGLFTKEFYRNVFEALTVDGIMQAQTENPFFDHYDLKKIYTNIKASFPVVQSFSAPLIIYPGVFWTFAFASKKFRGDNLSALKVGRMSALERSLKWYNMDWHQGAFKLSNLHRQALGL